MPLSEHVYGVAITFKSASNFALSLIITPRKLFSRFTRPRPWTTGDWQLHHDNVPTYTPHLVQTFLVKHEILQVTQPFCSLDLGPYEFWLFPKLKSPLKGKRFQPLRIFRKIWQGRWWWLGELCEVPRCLLWRGLRRRCSTYNISSILYLLQ